jgi:NAD+ dependent glucose-6-phosphate dehydrogenase
MTNKHRLLITGAAGRIGSAFVAEFPDRFHYRLADRPGATFTHADHEITTFDIADLDAFRTACQNMDTVLHLAADPDPEADFQASLRANNITGAWNAFRAAADTGCRRIVFASSIHAVAGYPSDEPIQEGWPPFPINEYGATKAWGESLAHVFAHRNNLSCIAIRIGAYEAPWIQDAPNTLNLSAYISVRDMNQLIMRTIETPNLAFAIAHGISNNRIKRMDLAGTIATLGYSPQDDGFAIYGPPTG